jgi:hypothetical protein
MNCFNIPVNIISIIVSVVTWFSYFSLIMVILQRVTVKSIDLYQYKLRSKSLSLFFAGSYILVFILFLYGLRFYNIHRTVDLKEVYQSCLLILNNIMLMSFFLRFNLVLLCVFTFLLLLVFLLSFHKFFTHHIFMLYIYYTYIISGKRLLVNYFLFRFHFNLGWIGSNDLITYFLHQILYKLSRYSDGPYVGYKKLPRYHPYHMFSFILYHQRLKTMIILSPIIFIGYDCIFNNWVLVHIYYYLLLYIPLMMIKRVTTSIGTDSGPIIRLLWDIYYKKELCFYALSIEHKRIIDIYLLSGLRHNIDLGLDIEMYLESNSRFELYNEERNTYMNSEGIYLQKTVDNKVFLEIEIEDDEGNITYSLGEEWVLLTDKTKTNNMKNSKTLYS